MLGRDLYDDLLLPLLNKTLSLKWYIRHKKLLECQLQFSKLKQGELLSFSIVFSHFKLKDMAGGGTIFTYAQRNKCLPLSKGST